MILAFALLVATILQTHNEKIGTWKEYPLALLLFSKFDDRDELETYARDEKGIKRAAEGLDAQLTKDIDASDNFTRKTLRIRRRNLHHR
jgi:hypothetical protein